MSNRSSTIYYIIITIFILGSCGKDEDPAPVDNFVGTYFLQEVIEEYNPTNPGENNPRFLAPENFDITKSDFLNPITGEMVTSYKFFIGEIFLGISEQSGSGGTVLVGTQSCPNDDDLRAASVTLQTDSLYQLNMLNCLNREVLATYSRAPLEN